MKEMTEEDKKALNATWESLPDFGTEENALAIIAVPVIFGFSIMKGSPSIETKGISSFSSALQPLKAYSSIFSTLSGIVIDVNFSYSRQAYIPIILVVSFICKLDCPCAAAIRVFLSLEYK